MQYIYGRNPVIEALRHQKEIQKLYLLYDARGEKINTIYHLAKQRHIPLTRADAKKFRAMVGKVSHQGVVALVSPLRTLTLEELLATLNPHQPGCLLILDRIQDPHNMGA
ncbi:MAG: TrmH family RNA methyltransferase, partial [Calditrichia bacterium]